MSGYIRPVPKPLADEPTIGVAHDFYMGGHGLLVEQTHTAWAVTEWMIEYHCRSWARPSALTVIEMFN